MDRGDVLSGASFKATRRAAAVFLIVLLAMAVFSIQLIDRAITDQVRMRVIEMEESLAALSDDDEGTLIDHVEQVTQGAAGRSLAYAVFDENGVRLAGNTTILPAFGVWEKMPVELEAPAIDAPDPDDRLYLLHATLVGDYTLVVGRSTEFVATAKRAAIRGFALTGFVVVIAMLGIGYHFSYKSQIGLERLENVLDRVSRGETGVQVKLTGENTQIERIGHRINAHLNHLDTLFQQTRRTGASVAHDLRKPLARATLGMENALAQVEAGRDARDAIEDSLNDLAKLTSLIQSILRIARIESGRIGDLTNLDLRDVLDEIHETFGPVAEDVGQELVFDRPADALMVKGDAEMLAQLVVNLVQNAITHAGAAARISLSAQQTGTKGVRLIISDNGHGLDADARSRVFEPFYRADEARSTDGSGLGMAIVKAIVDRHSAKVSLEDAEPGLRIIIDFPPAPLA